MQEFETKNIRNIALIGHGGDGKTTLAEAILFNAGAIDRQGKVDDGNTVMDFDQEEINKKISISLSVANCVYKGVKLNLIDVPGFFDFEGEFKLAMSVASSAVVVVNANNVLAVGAEKAISYCIKHNKPVMVFVNGMDKENADYIGAVRALEAKYSTKIAPLQIPLMIEQKMKGYVNVVEGKLYQFGNHGENGEAVPQELKAQYDEMRSKIIEVAAESDDELLTKFFDGVELTQEEITFGIKKGLENGSAIPVLAGSALANRGVFNLMNELLQCSPNPQDGKPVTAQNAKGEDVILSHDSAKETVIKVFKTIVDPFVGRFSLFKVLQGTLKSGMELYNPNKDSVEKIGTIFFLKGKKQESGESACGGDIAALSKLNNVSTGDTLCQRNFVVTVKPVVLPQPNLSMAIYAAVKGEDEKVFAGLNKLKDEDISFTITKNPQTDEMLLNGVGDTQLDILCRKVKNRYGAEVRLETPRVAYKETIKKTVEAEGKHKKQSGGAGQYGHCFVRFAPGAADGVFEFVDAVVGGTVPRQFIPAVERGLRESIVKGVLAGYPMVNLKATLFDGSSHPVDSKDVAYRMAASIAYKDGCAKADPTILEPIYSIKITVPDSFMGDILGDLNKRRGRILGMELDDGMQVISAEVPYSEVLKYATDLRSMTQGRGFYELAFSRYEEVPPIQIPKIIEDAKKWLIEDKAE